MCVTYLFADLEQEANQPLVQVVGQRLGFVVMGVIRLLLLSFAVLALARFADLDAVPASGLVGLAGLAAAVAGTSRTVMWVYGWSLRRFPGLYWAVPVAWALLVSDVLDLMSSWTSAVVLLAATGGFVVWVFRSNRYYPERSSRGDLGTPIPPFVAALTRMVGCIAIPAACYAVLLRWSLGVQGPLWPGLAIGGAAGIAALVASVHRSLMSPRYPCASAVVPDDAGGGLFVVGGHGNFVYVVRLVDGRPTVERILGGGSGLSLIAATVAGEPDMDSVKSMSWLPRLTPGFVFSVCSFSGSDGRSFVASAGSEGGVHVWDLLTGVRVRAFRGHGTPVMAVCPVPLTGGTALAATDERGISVYDPQTGRLLWRARHRPFSFAMTAASADQDRTVLVVGDPAGVLTIRDAETGDVVSRRQAHHGPVTVLRTARIGDTDVIVSCGRDGLVSLHELRTGQPIRAWQAARHPLYALTTVTVEGRVYLSVGGDGPQATFWNPVTGAKAGEEPLPSLFGDIDVGWYRAMCTLGTKDGSRIVGVGYSKKVFVLNPAELTHDDRYL